MRPILMYALTILICILVGLGLTLAYRAMVVRRLATNTFVPTSSNFQFNPPSLALTAQVTELLGEVSKIPRGSTVSAELKPGEPLLVGETITTGSRSSVNVIFGNAATFKLDSNSTLAYSSGLSSSLLLVQQGGSATYQSSSPLSIRVWHALVNLEDGEISLSLDSVRHQATLKLISGTASVAMIDSSNQTHILTLTSTPILIDDNTRTLNLIVRKPVVKKRR